MSQAKSPAETSAESVAWDWRASSEAASRNAGPIRIRAGVQALVAWAIAGLLYWLGHEVLAAVVVGISILGLLIAVVSPFGVYAAIEKGLATFARGVGIVAGWMVLIPLFYLFFMPFGLLFRRGDADLLMRLYSKDAASYWVEREPVADRIGARKRQF